MKKDNLFKNTKRIVIKVGSSLLVDAAKGEPHREWLATLLTDVAELVKANIEVILVSSGAVALGRHKLIKKRQKLKLEEKQAAAACGQFYLVGAYEQGLAPHGLSAAQVLLTIEDSENRRRFMNAKATLETLLLAKVIPVINENDTVATSELRFGDNDRLAARVAQMVGADTLVLLSDIDGLYSDNPRTNKQAQLIPLVEKIDASIEAMAGGSGSDSGTGGMVTKLIAARIAAGSGCTTFIARGDVKHPLKTLWNGGLHTRFAASETPASARKRWIAHSLSPVGEVVLDAGAEGAIKKGKSLLPAGVTRVSGTFERGDAVLVRNAAGFRIGCGLIAYSSEEAKRISGKQSADIEKILGFRGRDELIHRDDMALDG